MTRVFISYRHEPLDSQVALRLHQALLDRKYEAFLDTGIPPGKEFDDYIGEQLRACDVFLLLVTRAAHESKWVSAELREANRLSEKIQRPLIIPFVLQDFQSDWRMDWHVSLDLRQHVNCLDLERDWDRALEKVLRSLETLSSEAEQTQQQEDLKETDDHDKSKGPGSVLASFDALLNNAESELDKGNVVAAIQLVEPCFALMEQSNGNAPSYFFVRAHNALGLALAYQRKLDQAMEHIQKARQLLAEHPEPILEAWNEHRLGFVYLQRRAIFDALKHLERADQLARENEVVKLRAQVQDTLGRAWQELGFIEVAIEHYQSSLRLKHQIGDTHGQAISQGNLGRAYQMQGQIGLAREAFQRDLELSLEIGDHQGVMMMRSHLAELLRQEHRYAESLQKYQEYLHRAQEDRVEIHIAFGHLGLARVKGDLGLFEEADQHLGLARGCSIPWFEPLVLQAAGHLADHRGDPDQASFLWEKTIQCWEESKGDAIRLVETLCDLSQLYARQNRAELAQDTLNRAMETAQQLRLRWMMGRLKGIQVSILKHEGHIYSEEGLPFPLVLHTRRVDSTFSPLERLDALIELFKITLRYATSLVLSQYQVLREEIEAQKVEEFLRQFELRPPSSGRWAEAIRTVIQVLAIHKEKLLFPALVEVWLKPVREHYKLQPQLQQDISTLLEIRNQISHLDRPAIADAQSTLEVVEPAIQRLLAALQPLWQYHLTAVISDGNAQTGKTLMGATSLLRWDEHTTALPEQTQHGEVLLFDSKSGNYLSLSPWWLVKWEDSMRGALYFFYKHTRGRTLYFDVETRQELRLPRTGLQFQSEEDFLDEDEG